MTHRLAILAAVAVLAHAGATLAQSAGTTHTNAYDALSDDNRRIVSAIYEAQLGSPKDDGTGALLSRDEIAAMRDKSGWGNAYRQLHAKGMVTEQNLGQAISTYNRSLRTGGNTDVMVIYTAGGEQIAIKKEKPRSAAALDATPAKTSTAAPKRPPAKPVAATAGGEVVTKNALAPAGAAGDRVGLVAPANAGTPARSGATAGW